MEKLKEFIKNDKKMYTAAIIALVIGIACWGMFSGGIPDNGSAINATRTELDQAKTELGITETKLDSLRARLLEATERNNQLTAELRASRESLERASNTINELNARNRADKTLIDESIKLVNESQRELKPVRERGQTRD